MFFLITVALYLLTIDEARCLNFSYHHYDEMTNLLKKWNSTTFHPKLRVNLYTIGKSVQDRELWVIEVTAGLKNTTALPNVKLIGNIHGNEPVGKELLLQYTEFLLTSYSRDEEITWLLNNTRLHIMPSLNPDGSERADIYSKGRCTGFNGRENARQIDLNRNFPDYHRINKTPRQPETTAVMQWLAEIPFVLSASLHGGTIIAAYPFGASKTFSFFDNSHEPSLTPDNDVFVSLAKSYSNNHKSMFTGTACPNGTDKYRGGIINNAAWHPIFGGMADYNYFKHGCMELTLGVSCCQYPDASELPSMWTANKKALTKYCIQANQGITGVVFDSFTKLPVRATLKISDRNVYFNTTAAGRFWRILLPGSYNLSVTSGGYYSEEVEFVVQKHDDFPKLEYMKIYLTNSSLLFSSKAAKSHLAFTYIVMLYILIHFCIV